MVDKFEVCLFKKETIISFFGKTECANSIINHLIACGVKSYIIEANYTDKDYLLDYQAYYSRSFKGLCRKTTRFHFFSKIFNVEHFNAILENNSTDQMKELQDEYLGFLVLKPIETSPGKKIIGRTVIKPKAYDDKFGSSIILSDKDMINLCGIPLSILGLQFQSQDRGTSACATMALWMANKKDENLPCDGFWKDPGIA